LSKRTGQGIRRRFEKGEGLWGGKQSLEKKGISKKEKKKKKKKKKRKKRKQKKKKKRDKKKKKPVGSQENR